MGHIVTKMTWLLIMTDYLDWRSKLSLEEIFTANDTVAYPSFLPNGYLFLSSLVEEKGRSVLKRWNGNKLACITPKPFSLRTQINEYGGKPYWLVNDTLVFVNQADQCLYRQHIGSEQCSHPERISIKPTSTDKYFYSDVLPIGEGRFICIVEHYCSQRSAAQNTCFLGLVDSNDMNSAPLPIVQGADFYSNLVMNAEASRIAWMQWSHPQMPWDENQVFSAELSGGALLAENASLVSSSLLESGTVNSLLHSIEPVSIAPELTGPSHCQLLFIGSDDLLLSVDFSGSDLGGSEFSANNAESETRYVGAHAVESHTFDRRIEADPQKSDFWNVFSWNIPDKAATRLTNEEIEFGYPHWQFGDSRVVAIDNQYAIAVGSRIDGDKLFLLDKSGATPRCVYQNSSTLQSLVSDQAGNLMVVELGRERKPELVLFELTADELKKTVIPNSSSNENRSSLPPVSLAKSISYPTRDGVTAHGFYYPPVNHSGQGDDVSGDAKPPLLVMVHGGPTARAYGHFDIQKQFWTSNGFAIFDVNHRGSTGYGRAYRDALYGNWGEVDASDIVDGIAWLVEQGLADSERVCIRGKSAGGYAVLRALTAYPKVFKAGACYYGIGNLATLAEITHKFEKYYTDRLLGEAYGIDSAAKPDSRFYSRSPINYIDRIESSMIIFQGGEDKVVPPALAHEMVEKLAASDCAHEYVEYPDEAHGFRQAANNIDACTRELEFYRRELRKTKAD